MSKEERGLGKRILKEMQEAGKKTGWDVKIETEEKTKKETKKGTKEELNQRSEKKDENNNNKNMGKQEKGEKITNKEGDERKSSEEREQEFTDIQREAEKLNIKIEGMGRTHLEKAIEEAKKEAEEGKEKKEGEEIVEKDKEKKGEKKKSPELEGKWEEEKIKRTKKRESEIYERFYDKEKFGVDENLAENIQGILEEQMEETLVKQGKEWLIEQAESDPDEYPELANQNIEEFEDSKVMHYVKDKDKFWEVLNENEEWRKLDNLRRSVNDFGENLPPDVKVLIFRRLPEGSAREKIWEKLTGENLDEKTKTEAGIGEKNEYVETELTNFQKEKLNNYFEEEYNHLPIKQKETLGNTVEERLSNYSVQRFNELKEKLKKTVKKEEGILGLLEAGYKPKEIEEMKLAGFLLGKVKIKGEKLPTERVVTIIEEGIEKRNGEINAKKKELGEEWNIKFEEKKNDILKDEAEKTNDEDMIEKCYEKLGRDTAARYLEKEINKDSKRKAKIEKEFGKGKEGKENVRSEFTKLIKKDEELEGEWEEDEEDLKETLESWGIDTEKLTEGQKESYKQFSEKKWGLIDWILAIIFGEI